MLSPDRHSPPSVTLRPATARDADLLWRWRGEWSIRRFQPLHELSSQQLRSDVANQKLSDLYQGKGEKYQWILLCDHQAVGWVTLVINNWEHGLAELGYAVSSAHQGRGLMTEAVGRLLADVFTRTSIERVEARCAVDNAASRRVLEKNGFRHEGTLRSYFRLRGRRLDNYLFAILKSDYWAWTRQRTGR